MNWYELAGPEEVRSILEDLLVTYQLTGTTFQEKYDADGNIKLVPVRVFPSQAYEKAEALWGEYGE
jgi:hypothetical protein